MNFVYNTYTHCNPKEFTEKMTEIYDDACKRCYAVVIPFDLIATMLAEEAIDMIREKGLAKHTVKKNLNLIEAEIETFKNKTKAALARTKDNLGDNRFLLVQNMANEMMKRLDGDIFKLRMSVKQFLDKCRHPDSEFRSHIILADIILDFSIQLFDDFFKTYKERHGVRFDYDFQPARLAKIHYLLHTVLNELSRDVHQIDLNDDPNIVLAYRVINARISAGDLINESGIAAMRYDNEYVKILEEEEQEDAAKELSKKFKVKKK